MDFNKIILSGLAICVLNACGQSGTAGDGSSENLVGTPLQAVSGISKEDGSDKKTIVVFDETVRKIHLFDLAGAQHLQAYAVLNPSEKHYLVSQDQGNYILDISLKNVSLFNSQGQRTDSVLKFVGQPQSAAYVSNLNLFAVYDDLSDLGILLLDSSGNVQSSWVGGSLLAQNVSIASGDFLADGRMVLAGSDGSMWVVDTAQTLAQKKWVDTTFSTGLTQITWVAGVPENSNLVFVKSLNQLSIIDLTSNSVVSTFDSTNYNVEKYSKTFDPHVVLRSSSGNSLTMVYVDQGVLKNRSLLTQSAAIMSSYLNLTTSTWTYVDTVSTYKFSWNDLNTVKTQRTLKIYRFTDMAGTLRMSVPDNAHLELSQSYLFELFPSELGYAVRYDLQSDSSTVMSLFNMPHI